MELILASNSRTRKEILNKAGYKYTCIPSNIEEISDKTDFKEYVMDLSKQKGKSVASTLNEGIILSCDSIIYVNQKKLEKPKNKEAAKEMMMELSGNINYAVTGVTIIDLYQNKEITFNEVTEVYFDKITEQEIDWYINNEEYILERSGYSIESKTASFINKINGDYYNILGLPINRIYKELKTLGYNIEDFR